MKATVKTIIFGTHRTISKYLEKRLEEELKPFRTQYCKDQLKY